MGRINMEHHELDRLLSAAFQGGQIRCRELRLSEENARFLAEHYPVTVRPMGGQWYQVTFHSVHS